MKKRAGRVFVIAAVSATALMINGCGGTNQATTAAETTAAETTAAETTAAETTAAATTTAAETTAAETAPAVITFYRTNEAANVRKGPSTDAELITTLPAGYELNVPEGIGEGWTKIILGSGEAYISSKLVDVSTIGIAQGEDEEENEEDEETVEETDESLEDGEVEEDGEEEEEQEEDLPDDKTGIYIGPGTYTPPAGYGGSSSGSGSGSQVTQGPKAPAPDLSDVPADDEPLDLAPDDEDGNEEPNPSGNVKKTKKNSSGGMQKPEGGSGQGEPAAP